jgi:hypothetical protein
VPANLPVARDSAGIRIVETVLDPAELTEWTVSEQPVLEVGVVEGDSVYQFFRVSGVIRLADGRLAVANGGTNELRLYSSRGQYIRTVGGSGDGPGEYRGMRSIWLLPDGSVLVEDGLNARLTVYTSELELVGSRPIRALAPFVTPPPLGRFSDGRWVVTAARTVGQPPEPVQFVGLLVTYTGDAGSVDTIAELPVMPGYFERCGPEQRAICRLHAPFALARQVAQSGDSIFAGNGADFSIQVIDARGDLTSLWRVHTPARRVSAADIDQDRQSILQRARTDAQRRGIERTYQTVPIPEIMPAYSKFVVDQAGNLWVQEYRAAQDQVSKYLVFSSQGAIKARVTVPGDLNVHQIGDDYILGVRTDEADVEYIRLYRLGRGSL